MNHSELVTAVAETGQLEPKLVQQVLDALARTIQQEVASGGRVQLKDLAMIETVERQERSGRNPRTGEAITIAAHRAVRLVPATALKRAARG